MQNKVSNPNAWTFFADNDLAFAETATDNAQFTGEVAFLCQQAIEKYFKAFLTKRKISFMKTHDLLNLYSLVKNSKDLNLDEDIMKDLKNLYIESRYPTDIAFLESGVLPTVEDAKEYLDFARKVAEIVKAELYE